MTLKVSGGRSAFRTCQTSDAWLQHMKNLSTKMLITNLILDVDNSSKTGC